MSSKILDKIQALLQKTVENGASQSEAIEAAKAAQRLMAKYHVDIVDIQEREESIDQEVLPVTRNWQKSLAAAIAENTCCRYAVSVHRRKAVVIFFGKEADRKTAVQMFSMFLSLIKKGIAETRQYCKTRFGDTDNVEARYANSYITAIQEELGKQCRALALIPSDEVSKKFQQMYKICTTSYKIKIRNTQAASAASTRGYQDGKSAAMRRAVSE